MSEERTIQLPPFTEREARGLLRAAEFLTGVLHDNAIRFANPECDHGVAPLERAAMKISVALIAEQVEL